MANKQRMTIDKVIQQLEDDDIDWCNSEDEEEDGEDETFNFPATDHLDVAQMFISEEEECLEPVSAVVDTTPIQPTIPLTQNVNITAITTPNNTTPTATSTPTTVPQSTTPVTPTTTQATTPATNNLAFSPMLFTEHVGPTVTLDSSATALDVFLLVFGNDTIKLLADQTNLYAAQTPPGASYKWHNTNEEEMKLFLGMILVMGVHRLPQLEDYWSSNPLLGSKALVSGMSWRRFRVILSCLHIADNSLAIPRGQPGFDKLYKIRPLLNILISNFQNVYSPHREVSIDEAMVGFKGRNTMKQYMPMKPTKRGFKSWSLCDAHNGFSYNIDIYTGAGNNNNNMGLGPSVVVSLSDPLMDKGYHLYYDNYFSSVDLAETLLKRKTYSIATTRTNRKRWPAQLKDTKTLNRNLSRGQHKSSLASDMVECLVWKDNKIVSVINTISSPDSTTTVKRTSKDGTQAQIACPESIKLYNKYMGGVDLADARRKIYSCSRRSKKWWHRLFYYLLDVSVVNSFIVLNESPHCARRTQKAFILELAEQLMGHYNSRKRPSQSIGEAFPAQSLHVHYPKKSPNCLQCRVCSLEGSRKQSSVICASCNPEKDIHLCIDPCFRIWHTKNN